MACTNYEILQIKKKLYIYTLYFDSTPKFFDNAATCECRECDLGLFLLSQIIQTLRFKNNLFSFSGDYT